MSKKRTRKQKENAKHTFLISWNPESPNRESEASVKGQFNKASELASKEKLPPKTTQNSAKQDNIDKIKTNILKSLILACLILASEIVLYFFWSAR
jgi:hypothetical protein